MHVTLLPLGKIALVFAAILLGMRTRGGIGGAILVGSLLLVFVFGHGPMDWLAAAGKAITDPKTLFLAFIVGFIMVLSSLMEKTGRTEQLLEGLSGLITNTRFRLVFFPALIGLLPMPGGAIFSAPLIEKTAQGVGADAMDKTLLNYWFRHVWEPSWPLYPGIILAASLAEMPIGTVCLMGFPGVLALIALGWWFYLRPGALPLHETGTPHDAPSAGCLRILYLVLPLVMAIGGAVFLEMLISVSGHGISMEWGVVVALALAVVVLVRQEGVRTGTVLRQTFSVHVVKMLFVIVAVFIFKEAMQAADVVTALANALGGEGALWTCAVVLPFLVGFVSGITLGFVGATFPLFLGVLAQNGMQDQAFSYVILALFSGYSGILASPLHICFALTCEYFHVPVAKAWRKLLLPSLLFLFLGVGYFLLLR
jgi:integral membrane protein (TIGR00529 family)